MDETRFHPEASFLKLRRKMIKETDFTSPYIRAHGSLEKKPHTPDMFKVQELSGSNKKNKIANHLPTPLECRKNSVRTKKEKKQAAQNVESKKGINTQKEVSKMEILYHIFFFKELCLRLWIFSVQKGCESVIYHERVYLLWSV